MTNDVSPEFWERADKIIAVANEQAKEFDIGKVSSSTLYAAARYCAFNVASSADDVEEMQQDKEEAIRYFVGQFQKMLTENLDEYIASYEKYKPHGK
ncbi:hypothetical protein A3762_12425 [Oleiphilus sp. HI0125]|uniref:DUF3144 domain-containing protein n=1 Tax=Oleiphilus sp. HI0125 TaxID=1822266 RepID=UPI0007C235DA|nr:DUF3144 domain-containing protein [Oleiphilus sp. HI0125]KZZ62545.1 hypothetical protein A3762_23155 [Oleiphilus sp. HI0125]KZZ63395.1 hypothetical protein A3762_12425 [Oleiphilus sp. HI0125]